MRIRKTGAGVWIALGVLPGVMGLSGCMSAYKKSVGANVEKVASRVYATDFSDAWQATLDALKSVRLDVSNRDAGFLQTRWMDNTVLRNLTDGDGTFSPYLKARYRLKINLASTKVGGRDGIKVTIQKEQQAQKDALEDYVRLESDLLEENTLLYRIGRIVLLKRKLARDEKRRLEQEMKSFDPSGFGGEGAETGAGEASPPPPSEPIENPSMEEPPPVEPEL